MRLFEVKQTGHMGVNHEKVLKILNRTIKIDTLNDEMTLEADTKLAENALESMILNGAKSVVSREMKSKQHTSTFRETQISGVDFVSQFGDEVGVCCQDRVDIAEAMICLTKHMKE